jgi:hypothetical protein
MKDFSNASFSPGVINVMSEAMESAVEMLPHPVSTAHVQSIAETILRTANDGERDVATAEIGVTRIANFVARLGFWLHLGEDLPILGR